MLRRAAFTDGQLTYDESVEAAQDYELWARALRFLDGANLPEALVSYRLHEDQVTTTLRLRQLTMHDEVARNAIACALPLHHVSANELTNMRRVFVGGEDGPRDPVSATRSYLDLYSAFASAHAGYPGLSEVKSGVAASATRTLLSAGRDRKAPALAARIIRMEPTLPVRALRSLARRALHRAEDPRRD